VHLASQSNVIRFNKTAGGILVMLFCPATRLPEGEERQRIEQETLLITLTGAAVFTQFL